MVDPSEQAGAAAAWSAYEQELCAWFFREIVDNIVRKRLFSAPDLDALFVDCEHQAVAISESRGLPDPGPLLQVVDQLRREFHVNAHGEGPHSAWSAAVDAPPPPPPMRVAYPPQSSSGGEEDSEVVEEEEEEASSEDGEDHIRDQDSFLERHFVGQDLQQWEKAGMQRSPVSSPSSMGHLSDRDLLHGRLLHEAGACPCCQSLSSSLCVCWRWVWVCPRESCCL